VGLITPHTAVPPITGGCRCWHWYPSRLSVCLAEMGGMFYCELGERGSEAPLPLSLPPLLCAVLWPCRSFLPPSFPPHSWLSPLSDAGFPFPTQPSRSKYFGGVEWLTTCFAWSEFREIRSSERRRVKREERKLSIPRGNLFYSKQAQCHPTFPISLLSHLPSE